MRKRPAPLGKVNLSIRRAVRENPGIHFRGLARAAHVTSAGQLRHHLDRLARQGVVIEVEDGRYKRYFVAGDQDPKTRHEMARFARAGPRRIAELLLERPRNRTELRRSLGCADSTLGYHLSRMVTLGDLAKERGPNCCMYSLTSEENVRNLLLAEAAARSGPDDTPVGPHEVLHPDSMHLHARTDDDELPNPLRPRVRPPPHGAWGTVRATPEDGSQPAQEHVEGGAGQAGQPPEASRERAGDGSREGEGA